MVETGAAYMLICFKVAAPVIEGIVDTGTPFC